MKIQSTFMVLILLCGSLMFNACDDDGDKDKTSQLLPMLLLGGGYSAGNMETYTADGVSFDMVYVPRGKTFPTGTNDQGEATVAKAYWIGETEVTYELWYKVYTWAIDTSVDHDGDGLTFDANADNDVYIFANTGIPGHNGTAGTETASQEPVTMINWRNAMVWCNALTEWYNAQQGTGYDCVYTSDSGYTTPIRTSTNDSTDTTPADGILDNSLIQGSEDYPYLNVKAKGFRLPTGNEWELAARYIDGTTWLYGDHASGDQSGACYDDGSILGGQGLSTVFGDYAVYLDNSGLSTAIVKSKTTGANALGLYDMSGNIMEYVFDWYLAGICRVAHGGGWFSAGADLQVGYIRNPRPYDVGNDLGFRFARTQ